MNDLVKCKTEKIENMIYEIRDNQIKFYSKIIKFKYRRKDVSYDC